MCHNVVLSLTATCAQMLRFAHGVDDRVEVIFEEELRQNDVEWCSKIDATLIGPDGAAYGFPGLLLHLHLHLHLLTPRTLPGTMRSVVRYDAETEKISFLEFAGVKWKWAACAKNGTVWGGWTQNGTFMMHTDSIHCSSQLCPLQTPRKLAKLTLVRRH